MDFKALPFHDLSHSIMYIISASSLFIDQTGDQYMLSYIDIDCSITPI